MTLLDPTPDAPADALAAFRPQAVAHVPGLPPSAGADFDISRRGLLGHLQRTALRALALDLNPSLAPEAVATVDTLGQLADMVGNPSERPTHRGHGGPSNARVRLAPLEPAHIGVLYGAATRPGAAHRWRFRGRTPSFEEFQASLFAGVVCQLVAETPAGRPVGLVVAFDEDPGAHHCQVGLLRIDDGGPPGAVAEAMLLFLDHLFTTFPYRKVFAELPEFNLDLVDGIPPEVLTPEGRQREFFWHAGRFWDRCTFSLSRQSWEQVRVAMVGTAPEAQRATRA